MSPFKPYFWTSWADIGNGSLTSPPRHGMFKLPHRGVIWTYCPFPALKVKMFITNAVLCIIAIHTTILRKNKFASEIPARYCTSPVALLQHLLTLRRFFSKIKLPLYFRLPILSSFSAPNSQFLDTLSPHTQIISAFPVDPGTRWKGGSDPSNFGEV